MNKRYTGTFKDGKLDAIVRYENGYSLSYKGDYIS